jgi:autotransporter-associated beta strand protein
MFRRNGHILAARRTQAAVRTALLTSCALIAAALPAAAQDATWKAVDGNFNNPNNWDNPPGAVPTGTAFFNTSNVKDIFFSAKTLIGGWTFNAGADDYTFTNNRRLIFKGAGIVINGGSAAITNKDILRFRNSSSAGNASITNKGLMVFRENSNAGSASITNKDTLRFRDASSAANATIKNEGLMVFRNGSSAGSATITNKNTLRFRNTSSAGNATISNNFGFVYFENNSSAGSSSITNKGAITFDGSSTAGTASIVTRAGGFLLSFGSFSSADNAMITTSAGSATNFLDNATGGNARFVTNAGGLVDFSGSAGPAGDGKITAGSIEGAGDYVIGHTLTVGSNNLSTEVSGVISDCGCPGSLVKVGSGTLTLSGNNTYTGTTDVNGGTLAVDGSIASSVLTRVNSGGTLAGTGVAGNTQVNSGGIFAPGSGTPGSSMTIAGNLAFMSGALYLVQVNPGAASFANVMGTASLDGNVKVVFAPGSYTPRSYLILHSAGLNGSCAGVIDPPNFVATLSYTATDAFLDLVAALGLGGRLTQNQANVAAAINKFFNNGGTLPPGFLQLFNLTGSDLANALTLLSGEVATGAQHGAFQLTGQFLSLMLDPFVDGRAGVAGVTGQAIGFAPGHDPLPEEIAIAYAKALRTPGYKPTPFEQRWSVWGGAYGGINKTGGDPIVVGSHDFSAQTAGVAAGMDYRVAPGLVVGFALAGAGTGWTLTQGLGSGRSDAFQAGVYGTMHGGPAYVAAALAYAQHWLSTDRYAFAGDHLTASFAGESFGARLESGYRMRTAFGALTPYAALQEQNFHTPTYSESDPSGGGFGLTYNAHTASHVRTELGTRFDKQILLDWSTVLALRAKLAWAHDTVSDPTLVPSFQALPGASFVVQGAPPPKDSTLTSAGAELRLPSGISFLAKFDGEFAKNAQTLGGTGTVRYAW